MRLSAYSAWARGCGVTTTRARRVGVAQRGMLRLLEAEIGEAVIDEIDGRPPCRSPVRDRAAIRVGSQITASTPWRAEQLGSPAGTPGRGIAAAATSSTIATRLSVASAALPRHSAANIANSASCGRSGLPAPRSNDSTGAQQATLRPRQCRIEERAARIRVDLDQPRALRRDVEIETHQRAERTGLVACDGGRPRERRLAIGGPSPPPSRRPSPAAPSQSRCRARRRSVRARTGRRADCCSWIVQAARRGVGIELALQRGTIDRDAEAVGVQPLDRSVPIGCAQVPGMRSLQPDFAGELGAPSALVA